MANMGRPPRKIINWDTFDKLVSMQVTRRELAAFFDISDDWLDKLCQRHKGQTLAEIYDNRRLWGRIRLRKAEFDIVEGGGPGAATMAIFLHKIMIPEDIPSDMGGQPLAPPVHERIAEPAIASYKQFCLNANYFEPFDKQLEMMNFTVNETDIRMLLGARGYGKTDYCTIMGVAYDLYLGVKQGKPLDELTTLIITKSKSRNSAIIYEIAEALKRNGIGLAKENSSVIRVAGLVGQDHSVEAITIKSSMRGRHPKRIVMDDPVTDEDVSEAMRATVKRRFDEAVKLCKNVIVIGQPAHRHDLYSKLRNLVKVMEVPHGNIPQLDVNLETLIAAGVDRDSIEMSYHLRVPESGSSPFAKIRYIEKFPESDSVAFIDPSDGGDYTAVSCLTGYFDGIAVEGECWQRAWYHCLDDMVAMFRRNRVRKVAFETNATGNQPIGQLRELLAPHGIGVVGVHSDSNKHAIIMAAGAYADRIHLSKKSAGTYTSLVVEYEYGAKHDDPPDSLARGMEQLGLIRGKK